MEVDAESEICTSADLYKRATVSLASLGPSSVQVATDSISPRTLRVSPRPKAT